MNEVQGNADVWLSTHEQHLTSFGLEVGDPVQDDVMKEQGFVVDLDVSGEQAAEVLHIPEDMDTMISPFTSNDF